MVARNVVIHYCDRCDIQIPMSQEKAYGTEIFDDLCTDCYEICVLGLNKGKTPLIITMPQRKLIQDSLGVVIINLGKATGDGSKTRLVEAESLRTLLEEQDRQRLVFI